MTDIAQPSTPKAGTPIAEEPTAVSNNNNTSSSPAPAGDATPTGANGSRKRTRATPEQLAVLEDTFAANVSPNSKLRKQLSERLQMSERSIQIWFQNRRAKVKHMQKRAQMQMQQASIRAQLYHYHQQQYGMQAPPPPPYGAPPIMPLPPQQHQQHQNHQNHAAPPPPPPHPSNAHSQQSPSIPQPPVYARMPLPRSQSMDAATFTTSTAAPLPTPPALTASYSSASSISSTSSLDSMANHHHNIPHASHPLAYPLQDMVHFPDYLQGPLSPSPSPHLDCNPSSSIPNLVSVPDAGPTAMLATQSQDSAESTPMPTDLPITSIMDHPITVRPQDIWPHHHGMRSQSVSMVAMHSTPGSSEPSHHHFERALSDPPVATIDPSSLMMHPAKNNASSQDHTNAIAPTPSASTSTSTSNSSTSNSTPTAAHVEVVASNNGGNSTKEAISTQSTHPEYDVYLNCTTLTIGTWHRLKLRTSDLVCVLNGKIFEWHIEDAGCHFKMEIPLASVASIDYMEDGNGLADVHFDISESPLFYMETTGDKTTEKKQNGANWVQCSDFTEGKQASRFFRHTHKGVGQQLKQDLLILMEKYPDTHRIVRFLDQPAFYPSTTAGHAFYHPQDTSMIMPPAAAAASLYNMPPPPTPTQPMQGYWSSLYQMPSAATQPTMLLGGAPGYQA
ncbi:hypothetical protein BC940DRAFT_293697 [Gongronella butleri]|nr:hypothetical protein BC940DRAFT_293697 [Gongronella butleri]